MNGSKWTDDEREIIARVYPENGADGVHVLLPHRSVEAIAFQASKDGVRKNRVDRKPIAAKKPDPVTNPGSPYRTRDKETVANSARLERVPDCLIALPWSRRPRDPQTCRSLAAVYEHVARSSPVKELGAEAIGSVQAEAAILREMADRMERSAERV